MVVGPWYLDECLVYGSYYYFKQNAKAITSEINFLFSFVTIGFMGTG